MSQSTRKACPQCNRLQERIQSFEAEIASLKDEVLRLREQLATAGKDSSTSSKPPSSDIVKPTPGADAEPGKRKIGGQPGHPRHERESIPLDQLTSEPLKHFLEICPDCGHGLEASDAAPHVQQQIDIALVPVTQVEHRSMAGWCPQCQKNHFARLPPEIEAGGLLGPRLTVLIAYLKGPCHASYSTIRKYLRDVLGITMSRGCLCKAIRKAVAALDIPYEELVALLPSEKHLNIDETGHPENGMNLWTWCFRAELFTAYKIDPSRGSQVLVEVLGKDFKGVMGCDYFSAYRRSMREFSVLVQFCLAPLIRDIKFLTTLPDARDREYGERLRERVRQMFELIHDKAQYTDSEFQTRLSRIRQHIREAATTEVPPTRHSQNMAKRFRKHGAAYFQFISTPGIEPTNNLAEQAIRFVVIDRHITQGTRSSIGRRWCERIWTVIATCGQQGRSVFDFLARAIEAYFYKTAAPSLLKNPT